MEPTANLETEQVETLAQSVANARKASLIALEAIVALYGLSLSTRLSGEAERLERALWSAEADLADAAGILGKLRGEMMDAGAAANAGGSRPSPSARGKK